MHEAEQPERRPTMAEEITAPLAGNIVAVNVKAGDSVEEDAEVFVIEAMKM